MIWPWIHIFIAYAVYIVFALASSVLIARIAGDLRDMSTRNAPRVLLMGVVANLLIMVIVLALLVSMDGKSISALGLGFSGTDALAAFGGLAAIFLLALGFVGLLRGTGRLESVGFVQPAASGHASGLLLGLGLIASVALQEEVLNRGYVTLNLISYSTLAIVLISTAIFTLIHFLTNRASLYQIVSWVVGGLILILSYLLSGSLWVPIVLHFATDSANVLIFNITGEHAAVVTSPPLTVGQRAAFRVIYGLVLAAMLFAVYGTTFALG